MAVFAVSTVLAQTLSVCKAGLDAVGNGSRGTRTVATHYHGATSIDRDCCGRTMGIRAVIALVVVVKEVEGGWDRGCVS